jgi:hypothetical protein
MNIYEFCITMNISNFIVFCFLLHEKYKNLVFVSLITRVSIYIPIKFNYQLISLVVTIDSQIRILNRL